MVSRLHHRAPHGRNRDLVVNPRIVHVGQHVGCEPRPDKFPRRTTYLEQSSRWLCAEAVKLFGAVCNGTVGAANSTTGSRPSSARSGSITKWTPCDGASPRRSLSRM